MLDQLLASDVHGVRMRRRGRANRVRGLPGETTRAAIVTILVALGALAPAPTHAAGEVGTACRAEQRRVCGEVPPGGGRFKECLRAQVDRLSPECRPKDDSDTTRPSGSGRMTGACRAEIDAFCRSTPSGGGRLYRCLRGHESELSVECRHALGRP
jgi:hypothetical protein